MTPVHELMHSLGFVHEHTRPDRDNFVAVNTENIVSGKEANFKKRKQGYSDFFNEGSVNAESSPYDVLSLLHYGPKDFSANGKDVITFLHGLPDETWPAPQHEDPLSVIDQVTFSLVSSDSFLSGGVGNGIWMPADPGANAAVYSFQQVLYNQFTGTICIFTGTTTQCSYSTTELPTRKRLTT